MQGRTSLVLIAHADENLLKEAIAMVRAQTLQPFELIVCFSNMEPISDQSIIWAKLADRNDYGYEKRAAGLGLARGEFICWWNFDDLYEPNALEKLEAAMDDEADVTHCLFVVRKPGSSNTPNGGLFKSGYTDAGSFLVRTKVARAQGYTGRHSCADGDFIDELAKTARVKGVNEVLMIKR